ncbi:MAG: hypothetical protein KDD84_08805 [Caldilineaceae bacterium]|nr:hypothetical protein [Caldilineaceae bacterium]
MTQDYSDPYIRRRTVLVAVVNNEDDLRRAASDGWYRIPQRRAPRRIGADYLAFYQTGAFGKALGARTVTYYAPVRRYHLATRAQLLPEDADHPRADDYYFRIDLGPLMRLDRPIEATKLRRITFIHTTFERLLNAADVTDLFIQDDSFDALWQALHANRLRPLPNRLAGEWPVDIALRVRGGYLGIRCVDENSAAEARFAVLPARWTVLNLDAEQIRADLPSCLRQIASTLVNLGGALDSRPGPEFRLP